MKVLFILPALLLASVTSAFSMIILAPTSSGTVSNGASPTPGIKPEGVTSVKGGLNIETRVSNHLSLRPGILYSVYGFRNAGATGADADKYKVSAIEVPFYVLAKIGTPCRPRIILGAGLVGIKPLQKQASSAGTPAENAPAGPTESTYSSSPQIGSGVTAGIEFPKGLAMYATYQSVKNGMGNKDVSMLNQYSAGMSFLINKNRIPKGRYYVIRRCNCGR